MSRIEKAEKINRMIVVQRDIIKSTMPDLINQSTSLIKGDAAESRVLASTLSVAVDILTPRDWAVNMTTDPGDIVYSPDKKYAYVFTGVNQMKHTNPTFYPGAVGVYHWAIIPNIHNGVKVYPDVSGIIVAVRKDESWYDNKLTTIYKWVGEDNKACSWYPGQAGVHQWTKIT